MQVLRERLAPGVEDRRDPDDATEVPRVSAEGEQRVGRRAKQERIDHPRIALGEWVEVVRQCEDDVEVRNGEEIGATRSQPSFLGQRLAFRAMAIATGVIGDPRGAAVVTRLPMPAEGGGPAGGDRPQRPMLRRGEPMRPSIGVAVRPHDVRELEPRTGDRVCRAFWHGAHGQSCRGGAKPARRSSGESGPTSV